MTNCLRPLLVLSCIMGALPARATTYTQLITLTSCRAVPTTNGLDAVAVDATAGVVRLGFVAHNSPIDSVVFARVVCDLRLPPTATRLSSVTLEYALEDHEWYWADTRLDVFLSEQLTPALPYSTKTRFKTSNVGGCVANTPNDHVNTLFSCTANTNRTLVAYNDYIVVGSRLVVNDRHDLFSAYATVALPSAKDGEDTANAAQGYRLRVSYDAP